MQTGSKKRGEKEKEMQKLNIEDLIAPQFYDFGDEKEAVCLTCAGSQKFSDTESYRLTCKECE